MNMQLTVILSHYLDTYLCSLLYICHQITNLPRSLKLTMSKTIGKDNVTEHIIPDRVSNTAWISEGDFNGKLLPRITKRLELATGLSAYGAEPYQVLNYGIGGHYKPHLDCPPNFKLQRVATMLIYLSDVEYGGGTVFVKHGVRAEPKKGDATFWFNLNKAGETDLSTKHAGCPVLLGEKWVVNKWFNYHEQFSTRKCGLSPDE
ncbi:prolyl 4-hydroxylase subunit alpha-1-like isoform X1 [Ptychodera flava]|uniref:prolyl 4-hydroxylase subunit alpha-1-like isoform X1 n=1 Tax=Ptychodera flava TaxID=63121 RepID=UPI003969E834